MSPLSFTSLIIPQLLSFFWTLLILYTTSSREFFVQLHLSALLYASLSIRLINHFFYIIFLTPGIWYFRFHFVNLVILHNVLDCISAAPPLHVSVQRQHLFFTKISKVLLPVSSKVMSQQKPLYPSLSLSRWKACRQIFLRPQR